jgi:hypothetical protein
MSSEKSTGLSAVAGGISEALITTAFGLFVAVPAVWMFNYFNSKIESFGVEMNNSSSELIDYFLKKRGEALMSMAVGGGKGNAIADINVTPMVDIMLVLLIIFMVVTPLLQKGVSVDLAKTKNPREMREA